jgi:transposase-like protein
MAVELSYAKGSVKTAAAELGIDPGRISKWRQAQQDGPVAAGDKPALTADQIEIKRLQKELKEAQLERDILDPMLTHVAGAKRWSASFPRATADLRVYKGTRGSILC